MNTSFSLVDVGSALQTKNLSVNNVYAQLDLAECDDGCGQIVERQKSVVKLFISHQQFSESVEPPADARESVARRDSKIHQ